MTFDALLFVRFLFTTLWRLFNSWYIPGTHTTPAMWFLYLAVATLSLRFLARVSFSHKSTMDDDKKGGK